MVEALLASVAGIDSFSWSLFEALFLLETSLCPSLVVLTVSSVLWHPALFMESEKTRTCYIPSTILLSVTDVGGVGEDLATMGQRGEDYADLHA